MYWKRQSNHLEWIVRQMSWIPPWTATSKDAELPATARIQRRWQDILQKYAQSQENANSDAGIDEATNINLSSHDNGEDHAIKSESETASEISDRDNELDADDDPPSAHREEPHTMEPHTFTETLSHPCHLWHKCPKKLIVDTYGYGRNPAFWFTLNLPFNYLWEIHRFQEATQNLNGEDVNVRDLIDEPQSQEAKRQRCEWVTNNPDIVSLLHAMRILDPDLNADLIRILVKRGSH